ncbi:hypothetical protein FRB95_000496 [Tulasnella sp. JGI-2019a]|nr:hypothetical protein FRB95_000496 [Tulasnella sp. JGI-2019a]
MSNHPDTLVAYVMQYTKNRQVVTASMTSIDSKSMHLSYTVKGSDVESTVRIPFDPPLMGFEEVKPRLMSMKVDAEVDLGMAKNPIIARFEIPFMQVLPVLILEMLLVWTTYSKSLGAQSLRQFVGPQIIKSSWIFMVVMHVSESCYVLYLCTKHQTPFASKFLWWFSAILLGYPFIFRYRGLVKEARIDSIMKGS